jgi:Nif-specific regulatory protein
MGPDGAPVSAIERAERGFIVEALDRHGWNQSKAARSLGITPRQIGYKMKKYGIAPGRGMR